jgi:hypothetical protein
MPRVVDRLVAAETARMLGNDDAVLADDDALGISLDLAGRPTAREATEYLLLSKRTSQVLETEACVARNPSNRLPNGTSCARSASKTCPDRPIGQLRVLVRLGAEDALVEQASVQLRIARHRQARRQQALANVADLVLDLPLLPACRWRAGGRLDQVMAPHLQKTAVEPAVLADEHRLDCRLHIVLDAAPAGALEEINNPGVGVEQHLLALARIGAHKRHPAVTGPNMRHP